MHPIPSDQTEWSVYGKLYEDVLNYLRSILEEASTATKRDAVTQKIGDYYASCMDEAEIEKPLRVVNFFCPPRRCLLVGLIVFILPALLLPASVATATGHFEMYCDGVGIFLAKIDGAPAPGRLVLFSYLSFPPGTLGGRYFGQGKWSEVYIYRDGCLPDGKCESIAHGKVWIDTPDTPDAEYVQPKRLSGKYEIDLNGKHLEGRFVAKEHNISKHPPRLCM